MVFVFFIMYLLGIFITKLCEYNCVKKEVESKDVVIKGIGKKELGMLFCIAKKLGFFASSNKPVSTLQNYHLQPGSSGCVQFSLCQPAILV